MGNSTLCLFSYTLSIALAAMPATAATKVFLLAGQSNMAGCGVSSELVRTLGKYGVKQQKVKLWDGGSSQWSALPSSYGFGPEVSFGYEMHTAFPKDDIYLVKWAQGSTSLFSDWRPGDNGGPCYKAFKATALAAIKNLNDAHLAPTAAGMLWMQGEHDAAHSEFAPSYQTNLVNFIAAMRADFIES